MLNNIKIKLKNKDWCIDFILKLIFLNRVKKFIWGGGGLTPRPAVIFSALRFRRVELKIHKFSSFF